MTWLWIAVVIWSVLKLNKTIRIMATKQSEIAAQLVTLNQTLTDIGSGVSKIGSETDTLNTKIQELTDIINAGGDATQEVIDALAAVQTSASALQVLVQSVDEKVPDAPAPEPEPAPELPPEQ